MKATLLLLTLALAACTTTTTPTDGQCPFGSPVVGNANGLLHGVGCTDNSQCKYGTCTKTAMQQGKSSTTGVCTKQCSCGGTTSQCSIDNDDTKGLAFTCIKAASGSGSECGVTCKTDADCGKINPNQPYCVTGVKGVFSAGALKVCSSQKQS